jgi:hypothetical protein
MPVGRNGNWDASILAIVADLNESFSYCPRLQQSLDLDDATSYADRKLKSNAFPLGLNDYARRRTSYFVVGSLSLDANLSPDVLRQPSETIDQQRINQMNPSRRLVPSIFDAGVRKRLEAVLASCELVQRTHLL